MVLQDNNQFSVTRRKPSLRMAAKHADPVPFAAVAQVSGENVFVKSGTPVYTDPADSNLWKVWTAGQAIHGFLYFQDGQTRKTRIDTTTTPQTLLEGIILDDSAGADEEVHGVVMVGGQIHLDDVVLPPGEVQGTMETALRLLVNTNLHVQEVN